MIPSITTTAYSISLSPKRPMTETRYRCYNTPVLILHSRGSGTYKSYLVLAGEEVP